MAFSLLASSSIGRQGRLVYPEIETIDQAGQISAPADARVIDIAFDLGFTHLGRMAGAYRQKFGEAPSATLQRLH